MIFKTVAAKLGGGSTTVDVAMSNFEDGRLILVTEYGKPGAFFRVQRDCGSIPDVGAHRGVYTVRNVFGSDPDDALFLAATFLAEDLQVPDNTVFSIGLRDCSPEILRAIAHIIRENKPW